jgi:hypothetical protein
MFLRSIQLSGLSVCFITPECILRELRIHGRRALLNLEANRSPDESLGIRASSTHLMGLRHRIKMQRYRNLREGS